MFPYYSNLLLRRRRWTWILRRGALCYVLPQLPFMWSYGVFRCSVLLRVIIVFRDITYVIIILYSWHLVFCEPFWSYVWNNLSQVIHMMSTWFWHKNRVWHTPSAAQILLRWGMQPWLVPLAPTYQQYLVEGVCGQHDGWRAPSLSSHALDKEKNYNHHCMQLILSAQWTYDTRGGVHGMTPSWDAPSRFHIFLAHALWRLHLALW
jgi:hypothetical protein